MTFIKRTALVLCTAVLISGTFTGCASLSASPASSQPVNARAAAIKEFDDRIKAFRDLHKKIESQLNDPIQPSKDSGKINEGERRLTTALRQARANAKQGEFFTPTVAPIFREIVTAYFDGENPKMETAPQDRPPAMKLTVNDRWPQAYPAPTMPPTLLASLPKLPPDFAYRFADRTLVLMDIDSDLILDYLPYASRRTTK